MQNHGIERLFTPPSSAEKANSTINVFVLDLLISERKTIRYYTVDILVLIEMELKQTGARRNFGHVTLSTVMIK